MLGVGVLVDVEIFLNRSAGVREEGPLGSDGGTELLQSMVIVGSDGGDLSVRHCDLSDPGRTIQKDLDIHEYTDPEHNPDDPLYARAEAAPRDL